MTLKPDPQRGVFSVLFRASRDRVFLALWVFCYRGLLAGFEILSKIEGRPHLTRRRRAVSSNPAPPATVR